MTPPISGDPALELESSTGSTATQVLGVLSGAGGLGASTLAAAIAVSAASSGDRVLLVDADSLSGGLDLLFGIDQLPGLRWPDLSSVRGRLPAQSLHEALPRIGSLAVLSSARGEPEPVPEAALIAVVEAGRRGHDLVIVDLPRRPNPPKAAIHHECDRLIFMVSGRLQALAATAQCLAALESQESECVAVLRRRPGDCLTRQHVQIALGLPVIAEVREDSRVPGLGERGQLSGLSARSSLRRAAIRCLAELSLQSVA